MRFRDLWAGITGRRRPASPEARSPVVREPAFGPRRIEGCAHADPHHRAVIAAARDLPDDTPASDELIAAIHAEIAARRHGAGMEHGPAVPTVTGLRIRKSGLPDWWESSGSLLLVGPGSDPIDIALGLGLFHTSNALIVVGAGATPPKFAVLGTDGLAVVGDNVVMMASSLTVGGDSTSLIGEKTTGTWMMLADVRNAGVLIVGADCMFAAGVILRSDDTHAIRDAESGKRINMRGGRMMIEDHVWIGEGVRVMGDARIGPGAVVGAVSFVKGALPAGTISTGQPARPRRGGIVWTREDAA